MRSPYHTQLQSLRRLFAFCPARTISRTWTLAAFTDSRLHATGARTLQAQCIHTAFTDVNSTEASSPDLRHPSGSNPAVRQDAHAEGSILEDAETLKNNEPLVMGLCDYLERALLQKDFRAISELWSRLRELRPITPTTVAVRPYFLSYSNIIGSMEIPPNFTESDALSALDELAAHIAAAGLINGACARMDYYLKRQDPDSALDLALTFLRMMNARNDQLAVLSRQLPSNEYALVVENSGDRAISTHPKFVARAIKACVMKNTFYPLLQLGIRAGTGLPQYYILGKEAVAAADAYGLSRRKLGEWTKRFVDLAVVGLRFRDYQNYIGHMSFSRGETSTLTYLADGIVQELSEEEPCLTLDPAVAAASEHPLVLFTDERWAFLMFTLIRSGKVEAAERFRVGINNSGIKTPPLVQAAVIDGFVSLKMFDRARAAWGIFLLTSEKPAPVVYEAYIKTLFLEGRPKDALAEFERFEQSFRRESDPTAVLVFNAVLDWLVGQSRIDEARAILDRMKQMGPKPDATSFNVFIRHHSRSKDLRAICDIREEMEVLGVHGDIYTAALVLPVFYSTWPDAVQLVLAQLRESGIAVDTATCTTLIDHLVRSKDDVVAAFNAALAVIEYMEAHGSDMRPTSHTLGTVLCGIERRRWSDPSLAVHYRDAIFEKMKQHRRLPAKSSRATLHIIEACCENPTAGAMRRAIGYYRAHKRAKMKTRPEFATNWRVWAKLMAELVRRGLWRFADEMAVDRDVERESLSPGMLRLLEQAKRRDSSDAVQVPR